MHFLERKVAKTSENMTPTETSPIGDILKPLQIGTGASGNDPQSMVQQTFPVRLFHRLNLDETGLSQVYLSSPSGLGVNGLLKSASPRGLHLHTPIRVPVQRDVLVTVAGCCTLPGDVVYCVTKSPGFHIGVVFAGTERPEIVVGSVAVVRELEKPFTVTRGHVIDAGSNSLSMLCKTTLKSNTRVRVEACGWAMFGEVELVALSTMVASCLVIRLDAAFRAQFVVRSTEPQASVDAEL
jgi:hypothetical protein